jgi:sigma-B regulation protein RsbU (phosphoserine phosphatase)
MSEHNSLFITMWYVVYNKTSRVLSYAGAGHPPLIIIDSKGVPEIISSQNTVIGLDECIEFLSGTCTIEGKTEVYLYTDGAYEAELPDGKMLKVDDLVDFLLKHRNSSADEIDLLYNSLVDMNERQNLEDDFTFMKIDYDE